MWINLSAVDNFELVFAFCLQLSLIFFVNEPKRHHPYKVLRTFYEALD